MTGGLPVEIVPLGGLLVWPTARDADRVATAAKPQIIILDIVRTAGCSKLLYS